MKKYLHSALLVCFVMMLQATAYSQKEIPIDAQLEQRFELFENYRLSYSKAGMDINPEPIKNPLEQKVLSNKEKIQLMNSPRKNNSIGPWVPVKTLTYLINPYTQLSEEAEEFISYTETGLVKEKLVLGSTDYKYDYYYDGNGLITAQIRRVRYGENYPWNDEIKFTFTYNDRGQLTEDLLEYYDGLSWTKDSRLLYEWNEDGCQISYKEELWTVNENRWRGYRQFTYDYDENNNQIYGDASHWYQDIKVTVSRYYSTYNEHNLFIYGEAQVNFWDITPERVLVDDWMDESRNTNTYNEDFLLTEYYLEEYKVNFDYSAYYWAPSIKNLYEYDSNGNELSCLEQVYVEDIGVPAYWTNLRLSLYEYDNNNNCISYTYKLIEDDVEINVMRFQYMYDENNTMINYLEQEWDVNGVYWRNYIMYDLEYDEHNNCIMAIHYLWDGNSWKSEPTLEWPVVSICYNNKQDKYQVYILPAYKIELFYKLLEELIHVDEIYEKENQMSVFPSPANDIVTIDSKEEIKSVVLYDQNGRKVCEMTQQYTINVSDLLSGVYIMLIKTDQTIEKHKIAIQ